jgi:hypothetical protein
MINNTHKYQIEIYYPDLNSTGQCNQMLSYRYDLDVWNPPRQVSAATAACEAPNLVNGSFNLATRGVVYSSFNTYTGGTQGNFVNFNSYNCSGTSSGSSSTQTYWQATQKSTSGSGTGLVLNIHIQTGGTSYSNNAELYSIVNAGNNYVVGDTVTFSGSQLGGSDGSNDLTIIISAVTEYYQVSQLIQKDTGTSFLGNSISSQFVRNNISFGQDYSASILVHRVYPEVYGTGNLDITVGGADSVASSPLYETTVSLPIVTSNPWAQITQNEARITSVEFGNVSSVNSWQVTAFNWQVTKVQDTR